MPHVTSSDGLRIFYTTVGRGEPFLLAHGATHSWESWRNLGYVDALSGRYQVVLYDLRGHGQSDKPHDRDAYALSRQKDDVLAVLGALGIASCHVWGHSLGARVGMSLLADHPERVRSLVVWGDHPYPPMEEDRKFVGWMTGIFREGMAGWVWMMEETGSLAAYSDPDERRRILLEADAEAIILDCERFLEEPGVADAIPTMRKPVLMIAGESDEVIDIMDRAAREMPMADFVRVAGIAHTMCHCSWLLPYVEAFLQRVEAGAFIVSTPA